MSEAPVDIADLLEGEQLDHDEPQDGEPHDSDGDGTPDQEPSDHVHFNLDKNAREVDQAIKDALERSLEYPELPGIMVDLLSPGLAVTRLQADWLVRLEPWQHALIAFSFIFATAWITNPGLQDRIKAGVKRKKGMKNTTQPKNPPRSHATGDPIE